MPFGMTAMIAAAIAYGPARRVRVAAVVIAIPCEYCGRNSQHSGQSSCCGCGAPLVLEEERDSAKKEDSTT